MCNIPSNPRLCFFHMFDVPPKIQSKLVAEHRSSVMCLLQHTSGNLKLSCKTLASLALCQVVQNGLKISTSQPGTGTVDPGTAVVVASVLSGFLQKFIGSLTDSLLEFGSGFCQGSSKPEIMGIAELWDYNFPGGLPSQKKAPASIFPIAFFL